MKASSFDAVILKFRTGKKMYESKFFVEKLLGDPLTSSPPTSTGVLCRPKNKSDKYEKERKVSWDKMTDNVLTSVGWRGRG